jgi:hypothetical protein
VKWDFPSDTDMRNAHCIEMELRQVLNGGMAAIPALQMNFSGNQLRYFDKSRSGWFATGAPMPRTRSITGGPGSAPGRYDRFFTTRSPSMVRGIRWRSMCRL